MTETCTHWTCADWGLKIEAYLNGWAWKTVRVTFTIKAQKDTKHNWWVSFSLPLWCQSILLSRIKYFPFYPYVYESRGMLGTNYDRLHGSIVHIALISLDSQVLPFSTGPKRLLHQPQIVTTNQMVDVQCARHGGKLEWELYNEPKAWKEIMKQKPTCILFHNNRS